jgi:hypothetical protein
MVVLLTIIGTFALVGGSLGYVGLPYVLSTSIKSMINLAENGMLFPKYINSKGTQGMVTSYYLFAITNPTKVLAGGKASFEVKGPYKFLTVTSRDNYMFTEEGERVQYETKKIIGLDEENSANMDEKMWLINPVLLSAVRMVQSTVIDRMPFSRLAEPLIFNVLNMAFDDFKERLILYTTPRKMLMGRRISIFDQISSLGIRFGMRTLLPGNIFGLVLGQNKTTYSAEIWTGVGKTKERFADVAKYKGRDRMDVWRSGRCNKIVGTNGELYKPFPKKGKRIKVFIGGLCRSITLDPTSNDTVTTGSGIKAYEYEISKRMYLGARSNPANECFCEDHRTYDCQYDGLLSMGPCYSGAPLYFAQGNFKDVDPKIRDLVNWRSMLNSNKTSDKLSLPDKQYVRMDPITGVVLEYEMTMMALFKVVRQRRLGDLARVQPLTYMPLFAISDKGQITIEMAWPIYALQKFDEYQGIAMAGTALTGLGILMANSLLG